MTLGTNLAYQKISSQEVVIKFSFGRLIEPRLSKNVLARSRDQHDLGSSDRTYTIEKFFSQEIVVKFSFGRLKEPIPSKNVLAAVADVSYVRGLSVMWMCLLRRETSPSQSLSCQVLTVFFFQTDEKWASL